MHQFTTYTFFTGYLLLLWEIYGYQNGVDESSGLLKYAAGSTDNSCRCVSGDAVSREQSTA